MKLYLVILALLFPLYRFCEKETQGFSVLRIAQASSSQQERCPPEIRAILDQPFHYLSRGGQAFVFVSEDGNFVIKFPRRHFTLSKSRKARLQKKEERDATSYALAFRELREESGLLYLHLHKSQLFPKKLKIFSPIHMAHEVDLDSSIFILQKRGEPILSYLGTLIKNGQRSRAQEALSALVQAVKERSQKGIVDEDPRLHKNCGFIEGKPLFIDVGRFRRNPKAESHEELLRCTARLTSWLQEKDPALATYLQELCTR